MAGIGFELRRILAEDTYTSMVKGYLYSTVISSGPWLMSVLSLAFLGAHYTRLKYVKLMALARGEG